MIFIYDCFIHLFSLVSSEIIKPDPIKPDPIKPDPIKPDSINPDPIKSDPIKTDLIISLLRRNSDEGVIEEDVIIRPGKGVECKGRSDWIHNHCGKDGLLHGCEPTSRSKAFSIGYCWKQCSYGGSTWCWMGHWKNKTIFLFSNLCRLTTYAGKPLSKEVMGKDCYQRYIIDDGFCKSVCYPNSMGKNE